MQKRGATASKGIPLDKAILQRTATPRNRCRWIVAPKAAGSNPVGHPPSAGKMRLRLVYSEVVAAVGQQ